MWLGWGTEETHAELWRGNYVDEIQLQNRAADDRIISVSFYVEK
jgi:hypothetical protein